MKRFQILTMAAAISLAFSAHADSPANPTAKDVTKPITTMQTKTPIPAPAEVKTPVVAATAPTPSSTAASAPQASASAPVSVKPVESVKAPSVEKPAAPVTTAPAAKSAAPVAAAAVAAVATTAAVVAKPEDPLKKSETPKPAEPAKDPVKTSAAPAVTQNAGVAGEQFFPIMNYRMGPYAAGGTVPFQGYIDYMKMINLRDGGVNGVKLAWEECETEYKPELGVACYEKMKSKNPTSITWISTATVYATIEKSAKDHIPMVFIGNGRTDATDGRYFPYAFPLLVNYLSQSTAKIRYIANKEGGFKNLNGKTIVNIYHGSQYGRETLPILEIQAKKYGFKLINIEVPHPGTNQEAEWKRIRQIKPDWIILRSWGAMTPTSLRSAVKIGYPVDKMVGVWWSGAEEDVQLLGEDAKGYVTMAMNSTGTQFPVISDIMKYVYRDQKPEVSVGSSFYNRGIQMGVFNTEAMRIAQKKYGEGKPITAEQMRWGLENLKIDENRMKELGVQGMFSPISVTCEDHEGKGNITFQRWDGKKWDSLGELEPDRSITRNLIEESSVKYAKEKGIEARNCASEK